MKKSEESNKETKKNKRGKKIESRNTGKEYITRRSKVVPEKKQLKNWEIVEITLFKIFTLWPAVTEENM